MRFKIFTSAAALIMFSLAFIYFSYDKQKYKYEKGYAGPDLRPFEWAEAGPELRRIHRLATGEVVRLRIGGGERTAVQVQVEAAAPLAGAGLNEDNSRPRGSSR